MKLVKLHLFILAILVGSCLIGSKAWSQKQEQITISQKIVPISEAALAIAKGKLDRADSLRVIAEKIIVGQTEKMDIYEKKISKMNEELKLVQENCELIHLNTNSRNRLLEEEVVTLKKSRNFWKTVAIGIPTILSVAATYIILK